MDLMLGALGISPQANYYCRRKFLMVNGTHTTLAFMTLCLRHAAAESEPGDFPLIDWDPKNCGEDYYHEIWAWVSLPNDCVWGAGGYCKL